MNVSGYDKDWTPTPIFPLWSQIVMLISAIAVAFFLYACAPAPPSHALGDSENSGWKDIGRGVYIRKVPMGSNLTLMDCYIVHWVGGSSGGVSVDCETP